MKTFILGKRQVFIGMLYSYCMFIFIGIHANPSYTIHTESLTTSNGLSNNTVRHIYQDSKGFIWFSTLNGLNRYDGNTFRTFLPDSIGELPSLVDGRVKSVCEDNHGFLWISTSIDRFSCYDLKRDCFVDYTGCEAFKEQYVYITLLSDAVWLWGRGKGCRRVCYKNDRFYSDVFCLENGTLDTNAVSFIEQDSLGRVWIGTQEGLYVWQNKVLKKMVSSHSFVRIHCFSEYVCFITAKGEIWCIGKDEQRATKKAELPNVCSGYDLPGNAAIGNQWLIFTGDASFVFLPATGELSRAPASWNIPGAEIITDNCGNYCAYNKTGHLYYIQAKTGEVMSFRLMPEEKVQLIDKERYHVVRDSRGILWISTYGNGFYTYDLHTGHLSHFKADDTRSSVLLSDELLYMMEDRSGSIWIGADHTGVSHLKMVDKISDLFYPEPQGEDKSLYKNNVRTLASLSDGDIYMATRNGKVYLYDSTFSQKKYEKEYVSNVYSVCEDTAGVLWQGMRGGGLRVGNRLWLHHADNPASLASDDVYSLLRDRKGRMWVGTFGGGLDLALPDGKGGYIFRHFFNDSYGQKRIRMLVEDRNGWIGAATSDGVFIFRPERLLADEQAYYHYNRQNGNLRSNEIRHLLQDRNGNLWIAEAGAGFSICKPGDDYARLRFSHYGVSDGLVNDMIQAFAEDSKGNIWITTEYGVSCFDVSSKTFLNYFLSMQMLQNVYNETSALALPDGRILMGSNDGVTVVDPSRVNTDRRIPSVTFTDLRLNGVSAGSSGTERLFEKSLPYTSSVQLDYSQHSFTVYFSTLDYSAIVPPRFTYQLQGYDKGWSVPSVLPWGTYKNLPPGTYKLHVKACNSFGQWGDDYTTLEIVIVPPFWRTGGHLSFICSC